MFFFSSRRRHTRFDCDWSSDVCSSDLEGPTSHDVVDAVRRAVGTDRVGHLGTLDPFASGLLVLVLGRATRLALFAAGWAKAYDGMIRLGTTTATDDTTGATVATSEAWRGVDRGRVEEARSGEHTAGLQAQSKILRRLL